ncbi:unc-112-related protein-like isoform X2 [Pollicipes pollicipes]|uniref:unc-112-related protein-like isoform X2 n=2 Tax=Pollicipes pollicipes TaxID=41117 RepID=UPI0018851C78|nr:unc-112-related protein-like isoform X2 [Pollicipes pollicipes]
MASGFRVDGQQVDGFWMLSVLVTDLQIEKRVRVRGDMHVGGVMFKLVEGMDGMDWSDHALFWPERRRWLLRTKSTLDQYSVDADASLIFTPMHKTLRLQLPDLRHVDLRVNFSATCFDAVVDLCKQLGIRHPEELSLSRPLSRAHLKANFQSHAAARPAARAADAPPADTNTFIGADAASHGSDNSLDGPVSPGRRANSSGSLLDSTWRSAPPGTPSSTLGGSLSGLSSLSHSLTAGRSGSGTGLDGLDSGLAHSPIVPAAQAQRLLVRPRSLLERARMNVAWLDSSLSIMEQGVDENDTLLLRFKFYTFYDLDPNYDAVRINMLYEQAKWQILNEEIDCTEEEMLLFAGLQVNLQGSLPRLSSSRAQPPPSPPEDDVASALDQLQVKLEGTHVNGAGGSLTQVPRLADYLRFLRPRRFTLKGFKRYWFVYKDMSLYLYKSEEEADQQPYLQVDLKGCEVVPDVNIAGGKYGIKLQVPAPDGLSDMMLRCESEEQYARWVSACRLAARGRSMADSSFETEVRATQERLALQRPAPTPAISPHTLQIEPDDYVPPRFTKKLRGKLTQKILEAHANVANYGLVEAKLNYIKSWKAQPEFGISFFVVKLLKAKKEELLGIAFNRLIRMDINGNHAKTWRYDTMKAWNVNWEVRHMMVQFDGENIVFECLSSDCKVVHEFIGGYIFLQLRSKDSSQTLDRELFHKLTGGWR